MSKVNVPMVLGTLMRQRDPAEDNYHLARTLPPRAVSLNEPRLLVTPQFDPRQPVFNQGGMGSCASCSSCGAVYTAHNVAERLKGLTPDSKLFNPAPLYYEARKLHGWQGQDTGSMIADNLDLLLGDAPMLTAQFQYSDDYRRTWDRAPWDADRASVDYVASHRPFYPRDGQVLENIWSSLDAGLPVVLGTLWPDEWFSPKQGILPILPSINPNVGGHAVYCWGIVPGYILCANSWSQTWAADAAKFGNQMRPGDFAMPWEYLTRGNPPVFELRAVSPEPVIVPEPQPKPPQPPGPQPPQPDGMIRKVDALAAADAVLSSLNKQDMAVFNISDKQALKNQRKGAQAVKDRLLAL